MASDDENRPAAREGAQLVKATGKLLIEKIKADVGGSVVASFATSVTYNETRTIRETRTVQDMTSEARTAIVESNRMQFAVPEQERTRRSVQQTIRLFIAGAVAVVGTALIYLKPEAGWPIVGVMGVLESGIAFTEYINGEKRKDKSRIPKT